MVENEKEYSELMGDLGALKYIPAIACGVVLLIAYVVYVIVGKIKEKKKKKEAADVKKEVSASFNEIENNSK